ncbi:hypothetical protein QR680_016612 [Steinernema hermaphroditum]|uniref:WHEP-TRS domain-containing protein n=1 Tax=Steinernema hermaphroditum TaxID=289476 RepID=A0AA39LMQ8_9BILA|nr:hypothetical protein QR680_016612 [Steinernema hermaphroditum]
MRQTVAVGVIKLVDKKEKRGGEGDGGDGGDGDDGDDGDDGGDGPTDQKEKEQDGNNGGGFVSDRAIKKRSWRTIFLLVPKTKDAKCREAKDAIAKLLELTKQYKENDGEPAVAAQIQKQGDLVRELKGKDAKSQEAKDAIAKLLELKKQYKEEFGKEYIAK